MGRWSEKGHIKRTLNDVSGFSVDVSLGIKTMGQRSEGTKTIIWRSQQFKQNVKSANLEWDQVLLFM